MQLIYLLNSIDTISKTNDKDKLVEKHHHIGDVGDKL